ncbi:hypothetical protein KL86DES1_21693 [uncultured Desulfovibrio sp.]|uniref:Uncharacterized protein n=1 Tax=uncultured Desulfovibrio sp. TaxID=167968 RepID=A0A212L945_9BACT|nr:hypothetical protein KL86DES1_21693 [uncultured Desulfovibrio sp.]VZH34598.1 conserved protein of unknown function [Desulfovibrio sp. 86]
MEGPGRAARLRLGGLGFFLEDGGALG